MKRTSDRILFLLSGFLLFIFTIYKAFVLPITWDEAYSYLQLIVPCKIYPGAGGGMAANNHLLNTWLTSLFVFFFGSSEFVLRIPVLLSYLVYLYFTGMISMQQKSFAARLFTFSLFNLNPYLHDFFCISRGYGISFALLAGSLLNVRAFYLSAEKKYASRAILFGVLALSANLALIYFVMLINLSILLVEYSKISGEQGFRKKIAEAFRKHRIAITLSVFSVLLFSCYGLVLQYYGALFFGGNSGFWDDTVVPLIRNSLYEKAGNSWISIISIVLICFLLWGLFSLRRSFIRMLRGLEISFSTFAFLLLMGCGLLSIFQFHLLHTPLLTERSSLFLYVLFCFTANAYLEEINSRNGFYRILLITFSFFILFHFIRSVQTVYVLEWKRDCDSKNMITDLYQFKKVFFSEKKSICTGVNLEFELPLNYYRSRMKITWLEPLNRVQKYEKEMDFYIYDKADMLQENLHKIEILKTYELTGNVIFKYNK